jgi:hypothetical protein
MVTSAVSGVQSLGQSTICDAGVTTVTYNLVATVLDGQLTVDSIDGNVGNDVFWTGNRCRK